MAIKHVNDNLKTWKFGDPHTETLADTTKNWKYGEEKYFNIEPKVSCVTLNVTVFSLKILIFKKLSLRLSAQNI